jgi:copper chaperone
MGQVVNNALNTKHKLINMETLQFKTNINCSGCVAKVTPALNGEKGIESWKVDTDNPGKLLTIETEQLTAEQVVSTLNKAGFKAEKL